MAKILKMRQTSISFRISWFQQHVRNFCPKVSASCLLYLSKNGPRHLLWSLRPLESRITVESLVCEPSISCRFFHVTFSFGFLGIFRPCSSRYSVSLLSLSGRSISLAHGSIFWWFSNVRISKVEACLSSFSLVSLSSNSHFTNAGFGA